MPRHFAGALDTCLPMQLTKLLAKRITRIAWRAAIGASLDEFVRYAVAGQEVQRHILNRVSQDVPIGKLASEVLGKVSRPATSAK